jgi:hypothetical protein
MGEKWRASCPVRSSVVDNQSQGRSISRVLSPPNGGWRSFISTSRCRLALPPRDDFSSRDCGKRPTRRSRGRSRLYPGQVRPNSSNQSLRNPLLPTGCLVLQAVGFALPTMSPSPRCALTVPLFPPYGGVRRIHFHSGERKQTPFHHCPIPPELRGATPGRRLCVFCGTIPGIAPGGR